MTRAQIEARSFDLKAANPNAKLEEDQRTPAELLDIIENEAEGDRGVRRMAGRKVREHRAE